MSPGWIPSPEPEPIDPKVSPALGPCVGISVCGVEFAPLHIDPLAFTLRGVEEYRYMCSACRDEAELEA